MKTDWKALCEDLLWALENAIRIIYREDDTKHISTADPIVARARAALAEPVGEPAPPAAGEVAELVSLLRSEASDDEIEDHLLWMTPADARRAADLLERLAAPVPVAERLPSLAEISAWVDKCRQNPQENRWCERVDHHDVIAIAGAALHDWTATALPLPAGEVK